MKVITSFGGVGRGDNRHGYVRDYTKEVERLFSTARPYVDSTLFYDDKWLMESEYHTPATERILAQPGFGWMFKPAVIRDALSKLSPGDFLLWVDSNDIVVKDPAPLFNMAAERHIFLHDHTPTLNPNKEWTHRDMFVRMGCDEAKYWDAGQVQVNVMVFHKVDFTVAFVDEWVRHATDYDTMVANVMPNLPGFQDHRFEQSICSILAVKHGLQPYPGYPDVVDQRTGIRA